eukprot:TRINITY_DN8526_c0_g1_i1.p1 TRINITY_DN8526_c0_g1~~TRINITY_DN8526_c0_g1_i1.p1  ORF type:complete len:164 (+),score=50.98 TRINITY_DN8526_c0_g1_i1:191-682(+)
MEVNTLSMEYNDSSMDLSDDIGMDRDENRRNPSIQSLAYVALKRKNERNDDQFDTSSGEDMDEVLRVSRKIKKMKLPSTFSPEEEQKWTIQIKTLSGKVVEMKISSLDTIQGVKMKMEETEGIPWDQQRLIYRGKTMADDHPTYHYGNLEGKTLHLVLALRGG